MRLYLRVAKSLYDEIRRDLHRPHAVAAERVGFAKARIGTAEGDDRIVLLTGYSAVDDAHYMDDPQSGARIDSDAIRAAMTTILQEDVGLFHVHLHPFRGEPHLSRMDQREIPQLIQTFRSTNVALPHGIFLLSEDSFASWVWLPGHTDAITPNQSTVVGMPLFIRSRQ